MTSRKRDSFGRFSSSNGGSDLSRFGKESMAYKKPRNMGIHSSMPGYPGAVGAMSSGQAPPDARSLGASYSSGVIDLGSNSTSSVPIQARPWSTTANIPPLSPGALRNSYQTPGSPVILHNCDVFGRTKIANLFGRNVVSGDHLGLALVPVNLMNFTLEAGLSILGPSAKSTVTENYVLTLKDDAQMKEKGNACTDALGKEFDKQGEYHCWQWLPTLNGILCEEFWSLWPSAGDREPEIFGSRRSGAPTVDFIEHVHLGAVSNSLMRGRCTKRQMTKAPFETNTYTLSPQLELLLE